MKKSSIYHQSLLQLLLARRTIHQYKPEPVDREVIQQALISSVYVPNHRNTNPVRYRRIGKDFRLKLTAKALELKRAKQNHIELTPAIEEAIRSQYLYPDTLLVVTQVKSKTPMQQKEDYATLACSLHNISLVLWGHGVGTKWSSGEIIRDPSTYKLLNIDPETETIEAFFWIGVPLSIPNTPPKPNINDLLTDVD